MKQNQFARLAVVVGALASLAFASSAFAAGTTYLEISGVKGESTSAQGKDMIELRSFTQGVSMPLTAGPSNTSRASGRSVWKDIEVKSSMGLATPTLFLKSSGGEDILFVKIHYWETDAAGKPVEVYTLVLDHVIITSVSLAPDFKTGDLTQTVTMAFKKATMTYNSKTAAPPKGKNSSSWSLEENKGS